MMNSEQFDKILHRRLESIENTIGVKAKEYVRNDDRLHNFNVGARLTNKTREEVLWEGYALKHLASVFDIIDDIREGNIPVDEHVNEKIGDLINYLILLEACIKETISKNNLHVEGLYNRIKTQL